MHKYIFSITTDYNKIDIYESVCLKDDTWNAFLEKSPYGQHEQTDYWAQVKSSSGWSFIRIIYKKDDVIIGGAQILKRNMLQVFSIAYITRGPVFLNEYEISDSIFTASLQYFSKKHKLIFILIQPPDDCVLFPDKVKNKKYLSNNIINLIRANVKIDLRQSVDEIYSRFKRDKKRNIRKAQNLNYHVRYGKKKDLPLFFSLMSQACIRQNVSPQPNNLENLEEMWDLFYPIGALHLFFIEIDRQILSASLEFIFKQNIYRWKFGWTGEYRNSGINALLYWEVMKWAKRKGCVYHIDMGVDPKAFNIGHESKVVVNPKSSSYTKLRFGGKVDMLPESRIYSSYSFIRFLLRVHSLVIKLKGK